jgi:Uma2 family endonuclease
VLYRSFGIDPRVPTFYGDAVPQTPLTLRRWTRVEYDQLVARGVFDGESLELIGGQLIVGEPQGNRHAACIGVAGAAFSAAMPQGWVVRIQAPIALDDESEPEPDVAVVAGAHADYRSKHPTRPALLVEVAESSLSFDRRAKASLYARGGVHDYWIVNLIERAVEVHRDPAPDPSALYRWQYRSVTRLTPPAEITLLALPGVRVAVRNLLP